MTMLEALQELLKSIHRHVTVVVAILATWVYLPIFDGFKGYDGMCYPMLDGEYPCTFSYYVYDLMIWGGIITIIPLTATMGIIGWKTGKFLHYIIPKDIFSQIFPFLFAFIGSALGVALTVRFSDTVY